VSALTVFGAPGHRRIERLQAALHRRGLPSATVIDYAEQMTAPAAPLAMSGRSPTIKFDAPEASPALYDRFVRRGHAALGRDGPWPDATDPHAFAHRDLWYAGFAETLREIARDAEAAAGPIRWLNGTDDILLMCDKWRCQQALAAVGVDIPPLLGRVASHAEFRALLDTQDCDRVFLKPRYGSAAAGVIAYRRHRDGRELAWTTAEVVDDAGRPRLFNRLAPQRCTEHARIARLIDAVAAQDCHVEAWVPKPRVRGMPGHCFDLRVIAFAGEPRQRTARVSSSPMTNLHLGNRRTDPHTLLDDAAWAIVERTVRTAATAFPDSRSIGFDLIPGRDRCVVLEANAFGDDIQSAQWQGAEPADDQADWVLSGLSHTHQACAHG